MKIKSVLKAAVLAAVVAGGFMACEEASAAPVSIFNSSVFIGIDSPWSDPKRLGEYLYETTFTEYDYAKGAKFMKTNYAPAGACASVRNGNFFGRNYDGKYDFVRECVIHTPAVNGRHAVVGVAASINVDDTQPIIIPVNGYFKYLPFCTLDGINDAGFVCSLNLVEADYGKTTGTNPGKEDLNVYMAVRYLLDNAGSVEEAIKLLEDKNLYCSQNFELHFMMADSKETAIVEFINNKMVVKKDATIMTNYFNTQEGLNAHAKGVERYEILKESYAEGSTKEGMLGLMDKVRYSRLYDRNTTKPWYSEFNSLAKGVDFNTPKAELAAMLEKHTQIYETRKRTDDCWTTKHVSVYDIANKTLTVISQEDGKKFEFGIAQVNYIPGK